MSGCLYKVTSYEFKTSTESQTRNVGFVVFKVLPSPQKYASAVSCVSFILGHILESFFRYSFF